MARGIWFLVPFGYLVCFVVCWGFWCWFRKFVGFVWVWGLFAWYLGLLGMCCYFDSMFVDSRWVGFWWFRVLDVFGFRVKFVWLAWGRCVDFCVGVLVVLGGVFLGVVDSWCLALVVILYVWFCVGFGGF